MERIFISPSCYVQGPNLLEHCAQYIKPLGKHLLIITDQFIWDKIGEKFSNYLQSSNIEVTLSNFNGESSENEVRRIIQLSKTQSIDSILALGGGKTIDTAKLLASQLNYKIIICPTLASTDAPTSAISVLYTEDGKFDHYHFTKKSPDLILVDSTIISQAPTRMLASGIADGLSTAIEANAVHKSSKHNLVGGTPTLASIAIAQKCEETLLTHALEAIKANQQNIVTPALEAVIEANTLLSGLGFENGGLSAAHAIHNGFSALYGNIHNLTHGEKVAYTTLTQLLLENTPKQRYYQFLDLYIKLGLPTTLEELHLNEAADEDLMQIAIQSLNKSDTIHNLPFSITAQDIVDALKQVDAVTKAYLANTRRMHDERD